MITLGFGIFLVEGGLGWHYLMSEREEAASCWGWLEVAGGGAREVGVLGKPNLGGDSWRLGVHLDA